MKDLRKEIEEEITDAFMSMGIELSPKYAEEITTVLLLTFQQEMEKELDELKATSFVDERKKGFDLGIGMYFKALDDVRSCLKGITEVEGFDMDNFSLDAFFKFNRKK